MLVAYAWRAGAKLQAWPGLDQLVTDTGLHRDTLSKARKALVKRGHLRDTGERKHYAAVYELGFKEMLKNQQISSSRNAEKPTDVSADEEKKSGNTDEEMSEKRQITPITDFKQSMNSSSAQAREHAQGADAPTPEQPNDTGVRVQRGLESPIEMLRRTMPELANILPPRKVEHT